MHKTASAKTFVYFGIYLSSFCGMCVVKCRFCLKTLLVNYSNLPSTYKIRDTAVIDRIPEGIFVGKIVLFPNSIHLVLHITSVAHILILQTLLFRYQFCFFSNERFWNFWMLKVVLNEYSESGISESFLNSEMQNNCWQFLPHKIFLLE